MLPVLSDLLGDVVVPLALLAVLRGLGVGDVLALTVAGCATGVRLGVVTIRRRRLDTIGALVVVELAATIGLQFVTHDPRFLAARPGIYTALAGVWLCVTCVRGRPLIYEAATPMATKGDPVRLIAYRRAWERSAAFRARQRVMTLTMGLALIGEAVVRVAVVYSLPRHDVDASFVLSQLPGILLVGGALVFVRLQVPRLRRIVDDQQRDLVERACA